MGAEATRATPRPQGNTSTRTRIETGRSTRRKRQQGSQGNTSTRTRIETRSTRTPSTHTRPSQGNTSTRTRIETLTWLIATYPDNCLFPGQYFHQNKD